MCQMAEWHTPRFDCLFARHAHRSASRHQVSSDRAASLRTCSIVQYCTVQYTCQCPSRIARARSDATYRPAPPCQRSGVFPVAGRQYRDRLMLARSEAGRGSGTSRDEKSSRMTALHVALFFSSCKSKSEITFEGYESLEVERRGFFHAPKGRPKSAAVSQRHGTVPCVNCSALLLSVPYCAALEDLFQIPLDFRSRAGNHFHLFQLQTNRLPV